MAIFLKIHHTPSGYSLCLGFLPGFCLGILHLIINNSTSALLQCCLTLPADHLAWLTPNTNPKPGKSLYNSFILILITLFVAMSQLILGSPSLNPLRPLSRRLLWSSSRLFLSHQSHLLHQSHQLILYHHYLHYQLNHHYLSIHRIFQLSVILIH
jgi:hypothetical protein